ncbi:MAG: hypothetical protein HC898_04295 [Phycisphaerales bacterium]|nr:hypothetical protein [Phycisphaerales bacterium]
MAIFNSGNTSWHTVNLDESITNQALMIRNDRVQINSGQNNYQLTQPYHSMCVGMYSGEEGRLEYLGNLFPRSVQVGYNQGSTGYFHLTGPGTTMDLGVGGFGNQGFLEIGIEGTGDARISDGASASVHWIKLGLWNNASGTLHVTDQAQLTCNFNEVILIGERGQGTLIVDQGGKVLGTYILSATNTEAGTLTPTGTILVDGIGSDLTMEHQIELGNDGMGVMTVRNGATASTGDFGGMVVGVNGQGELNIESGGVLTSTGDSTIGLGIDSTGRAKVSGLGSKWDISAATLTVGFAGNGGTLHMGGDPGLLVSDRGLVETGQLHLGVYDLNLMMSRTRFRSIKELAFSPSVVRNRRIACLSRRCRS